MSPSPSPTVVSLRISTDRRELDLDMIHRFLSEESYWARGISRTRLEKALANSLYFAGFVEGRQIAFGRIVTDYAMMAHLKDVFVLEAARGRGYGVEIVRAILGHPELQDMPMSLCTADAHGLYARFGFVMSEPSGRRMERAPMRGL